MEVQMRRGIFKIIIISWFLVFFVTSAFAYSPAIENGVSWITTVQQSDGSWGSSVFSVLDTTVVLDSLQHINSSAPAYSSGIAWLGSQSFSSTDFIARKIVSLYKDGVDVSADLSTLVNSRNSDGGWGGDADSTNMILDTAISLLALKSASYTDTTVINNAITYLLSAQNTDGGFGFYQGDTSNVYMTSLVSSTLQQFPQTTSIATAVNKATSYLISQQQLDGSFGSIYETAHAYIALVAVSTDATVLGNAINYLTTTQSANGSWNQDPYSTALALRALANVKPNLAISSSDISFSNSMPQINETITITAIVKNTGLEDASNVVVRFYQGNPANGGTPIGTDQIISLLAHGSSVQVSITNAFTGTGSKTIYAIIDPDNFISEITETDNTASKNLWIATGPDIAVYSEDLTPSTYVPASGTAFTLSYTLRNLGETDTGAFLISLYDGNPTQGGTVIQTVNISGISGAQIRTGTIGVTLSGNGSHTLYLMADTAGQISELSDANNTGSVSVEVGGTVSGADLAITSSDIVFTPNRPTLNEQVAITAIVRNQGTENSGNFTVEIFDGLPESGGALISAQTLTLSPGAYQTVTAAWTISEGIHDIYAVLDRTNQVIETDETNNKASARIMPDMIDIAVSATDLVLNPSRPVDGDSVVLTMTPHNQGIRDTGAFSFALYDGDPNEGGQVLNIYAVGSMQGDSATTVTYTFIAEPKTYRFYAIADTENQVIEMYEDNNEAIRSLKIKAPGEILGPDLVPIKIDLSDTATDSQTLAITGTAHITLQNKGDDKIINTFDVLIFEDTDMDGQFTSGIDTILGTGANTLTLWPEGANMVDVALSGMVKFLHSPLYALVDSGDTIFEQDETNNLMRTGADCEVRPANPIASDIEVKWRLKQPSNQYNVSMNSTPASIANLTDDNGDGKIDENDIPAILFVRAKEDYLVTNNHQGRLWAVRGDTGATIFTYSEVLHEPSLESTVATGDIDNDGIPELIVTGRPANGHSGNLLAIRSDGTLKWDNMAQAKAWTAQGPTYDGYVHEAGMPSIADIDSDGNPEIIVGKTAVNGDGSIKWGQNYYGTTGTGSANGISHSSQIVDLDLDGKQEVVAGFTAYNSDGSVRWSYPQYTDGITAIGNLDDDIYPEIVLVTNYRGRALVHLLDHDGQRRWGPVDLLTMNLPDTNFAGYGSPPTIADFDGDGEQEIGITGNGKYFILDKDGNLKKTLSIPGYNSSPIAATVFDLNGDGRPEVMIHTAGHFRIFDGPTGQLLFEEPFGASGLYQRVMVADVNGDNQVEVIAIGFDPTYDPIRGQDAIRVYGSKNHDWVNARRIWNQPGYHVTNVNEDGTIPQYEAPSWLLNNTYHCQVRIGEEPNPYLASNLSASYLRATQDGVNLNITVRIGNGGAKEAPSGVSVAFYDGAPASGIIIGTTATTKALNPGEYQDITFAWSNGDIGTHQIYAMADGSNIVSECNESDNQTGLNAAIEQGLPDLKVTSEDITLPPGHYTEGSSITITASIKNIGPASAQNVLVKLYNGNPGAGGIQIGNTQTISGIDANSQASLIFTFDTLGYAGTNVLYIAVDPVNAIIEANESNNTASFIIELAPPSKPDLTITSSDITFSSLNPKEGDTFTIQATVHNRGLDASNIEVFLYDGDPTSGTILNQKTISQIIPMGGQFVSGFDVSTIGFAGIHNFFISIDPGNKIDESVETNNSAGKTLSIGSSGANMEISLDKGGYTANEKVLIDLSIANIGDSSRTFEALLDIEDASGNLVQSVTTLSGISLAPGETRTFLDIIFNTGKTFNGEYRVHARLKQGGLTVGEAFANFAILPVYQAYSKIVSDKIAYSSNESITLTSTVTSQSPNSILTGLDATVDVTDPQGAVIFTETKTLSDLMPEARIEFKSFTNTGAYPAGLYTANLKIKSNGELLTSASTTFEILSSLSQAMALAGLISANPGIIFEKESTTLSYTIQNIGNDIDLPLIQTEILIVDPDTGLSIRIITGETSLNGREVYANDIVFDSTGLSPKPYLIVLRVTTAGVTQTLSSAGLIINPIPNNAPMANAGTDQFAFAGQPVLLDGSQSADPDGDPLFFTWHFTTVPNASQTTDADLSNSMTPTPSFVPDAEGIYTLSLKVNDGLADSQTDTVSVFVNPPAKVDIHPETINLKSNGGSRSITGVLTSPVLSSFEYFTAEDGTTVTASFTLENKYIDKDGNEIIFTIPAEDYPGGDTISPVDADGDGDIDLYQLTLKFNRDMLIAGFKDANGNLRIVQATELTSTVIGNGIRVGSDVNTVILPPEVKK